MAAAKFAGTYIALIAAMLAGRLVWGFVRFIMTLWGTEFSLPFSCPALS